MNNKLISFAAAAATLFAFAACNKDANQIDVVTPGTGTYAKVSISMGTPGTRATGGSYDAGTPDEAKVNSIMLVVYDAQSDGSISDEVVGYGSTENKDAVGERPVTGSVSDTYEKVIELTMMPGKTKANAKYVVAYINVANELFAFDKAMAETTAAIKENDFFIMTNAAIGNHASWSVATPIVEKSLFSSPDAAAASTAADEKTTIYVERLAAKVKVALGASVETEADINIVGVDEKEYKLNFKATDAVWAPTGTAPKMYKLKNQWTEDLSWTTAVDVENHRNFWAKGLYYNTDYADFTKSTDTQKPVLNYVSSNALRRDKDTKGIKMGFSDYTTEHTYGQSVVGDPNYNALGAATSAIVLGQYEVTTTDGNVKQFQNTDEDFDFYLLLNKVSDKEYYTIFNEEQLIQYLYDADKLALQTENEGNYTDIKDLTEYFELAWNSATKKYALNYIGEDDVLYNNDETHTAFDPETALTAATNARHYNLGYAYFFAPIEHLGEKGKVGQYGVVRNHSYQLTVNSITSLGAPLDDDHFGTDPDTDDPTDPGEEPIIPDPTEAALIRAELNVLSWHVVSQGVDL